MNLFHFGSNKANDKWVIMSDHNDLGSFGDEQWKIDIPFFERMPSIYSQGHPSLEESTNPNGQTTSTDPAVALLHASIQRCPIDRWSQSEHDRWARPPPCTVSVDIRELWHHHSGSGAGSLPLSRHSAFTEWWQLKWRLRRQQTHHSSWLLCHSLTHSRLFNDLSAIFL